MVIGAPGPRDAPAAGESMIPTIDAEVAAEPVVQPKAFINVKSLGDSTVRTPGDV